MNTTTSDVPVKAKTPAAGQKMPSSSKKLLRKVEPYIWISPSLILMAIFIVAPILSVFQRSMNKVSRTGRLQGFNNFANFTKVLKSQIGRAHV